jgi:uncharacterized membrane protein YtjA (UPF0391 family)
MMYWAVVFFVIAIVSAFFGFGGISSSAADIGRMLFYVALIVFVVSLVLGLSRRSRI